MFVIAFICFCIGCIVNEVWLRKNYIVMEKQEYNKELNKSFKDGYHIGLESGRQEGLMAKITPNELRKFLGLEPLKGE